MNAKEFINKEGYTDADLIAAWNVIELMEAYLKHRVEEITYEEIKEYWDSVRAYTVDNGAAKTIEWFKQQLLK